MMETNNIIFNLKLARCIGLYQILDPYTIKHFGYNCYHIVIICFGLCPLAITMTSPIGLYFLKNDITAFINYFGYLEMFIFALYKMITIVYHSKDIWECVKVTSVKFMSYQYYNKDVFKMWQKRSFQFSNIYSVFMLCILLLWILSPCVFNESKITIINKNGSYSNYRLNIYNVFPIVSVETYNNHFYIFYLFEILIGIFCVYVTVTSDILIVMICFGLSCHLSTISDAIESLGSKNTKNESGYVQNKPTLENNCNSFNDFNIIILDHQNIINKIKDFYNIFRNIILTQIFMAANFQLVLLYVMLMNVINCEIMNYIVIMKLLMVLPVFSFQLFILCYLFGTINDNKDSIIFALYSSEWTDMDIKSKKQIVHAMKMNNANHLKIKFTRTKVVNLEMFIDTMRISYSMFSMIINYNKN